MRPMTARDALEIVSGQYERRRETALASCEVTHARRIIDALVELREAKKARDARFATRPKHPRLWVVRQWTELESNALLAAERKLAALERGEEPQA